MRKKVIILNIFVFFIVSISIFPQKEMQIAGVRGTKYLKNLEERYKYWWNMIYHISDKEERNVFLKLKSNRDRDIFIRSFWQQRDPTPGTEANEFKSEIEERFAYVNKYFSRGTSKPGWMTDMGKFYMILGKPNSIERFESKAGLYPAQVWYFYGDASLGLPTYFSVTFFKPNNTTEWKFYNPAVDGPAALLIKYNAIDEGNYEYLYNKIKELAPELAMPALTMIPNEIAPGFNPTLRNNIVLSNIYEAPKRKINVSYATHFLNYKGFVNVEASINYIENSNLVSITRYNQFKNNFVNFSFKPQKISIGYSEDKQKYFFNFDVSVSLRKGENYIYEYKKKFDFYIDPAKVESLKTNGIIIHDSFPAIPGDYQLMVYAINSIGKEFTYFEKKIHVPPLQQTPVLATPIIGYKTQLQSDNFFFTYRFKDKKLFVDTGKNLPLKAKPLILLGVYNINKKLWENGKIQLELKGLNERLNFNQTYTLPLNQYSFNKNMNILYTIAEDTEGLNPDYYELKVCLLDGAGLKLDNQNAQLGVSPLRNIAHPMETFKKIRAENPYLFHYILGTQYEKIGEINEAQIAYSQALESNPNFHPGLVKFLNILNKKKKYTQVLVEIEALKGNEELSLEYHLIKATALYGMKDFSDALKHLLKANSIYDSDIRVLNLLGFTLLNLNDYDEALKVFNASLSLDNKQNLIKQTVEKVKKQKASKRSEN